MDWSSRSGLVERETYETFQEAGVAFLPGLFADRVEPLRRGVEANMADPGPDSRHYRDGPDGPEFFGDYCNWQRFPEYRAFLMDSPAAAVAADLMGASEVRLFHEHVLVKQPGASTRTPWHQDQPYYCVEAALTCSLWLPLDPVPRETSPEFVAGSHRWGTLFRPERFDGSALNPDDGHAALPDIDGERAAYDIRGWAMEPGDVVAFTYRTLHGAPANASKTLWRRAFSSRWVGEDARFARPPGITSPPFREVALAQGAPLDGPAFPLVWPAEARVS